MLTVRGSPDRRPAARLPFSLPPMTLPDRVPLMVLPGAPLFPNALLPLFIFEPRYRAMLAHALTHDRMFAVATLLPGVDEARAAEDFFPIAGVGLVRACVGNIDGTSHLILQGLARVRFTGSVQERPFRIARIEGLPTTDEDRTVEIEALGAKVLELCRVFQERGIELPTPLAAHLSQLSDPDVMADLVAAQPFFIEDPYKRQRVLETPSLPARLRLLIRFLGAELETQES